MWKADTDQGLNSVRLSVSSADAIKKITGTKDTELAQNFDSAHSIGPVFEKLRGRAHRMAIQMSSTSWLKA